MLRHNVLHIFNLKREREKKKSEREREKEKQKSKETRRNSVEVFS